MNRIWKVWPWFAAVVSGLLYAGCFPPFDQAWLGWIALTPLIAAIWFSGGNSKRRWLRNLLLGYVTGLVFFWTVLSWLTTVTAPGWFLLQFYMGSYLALWGWFCGLMRPRETSTEIAPNKWEQMLARDGKAPSAPTPVWLRSTSNLGVAFLLAVGWVAQEWLRSWMLTGWGWNGLGVALHKNWLIIQIAEYTGVIGLSFVLAFANTIVVTTTRRIILEARVRPMRPHWDLNFTVLGLMALLVFGWRVAHTPRTTRVLRVAAVQADIPRAEKFNRQFTQRIFDEFTDLSENALRSQAPPELLVWPESSMPGPVLSDEITNRFVMEFSAATKADLLLGTLDQDGDRVYNAAILVSDGGQKTQLYRKLHLVPFGEYIPLRHAVPLFAQLVGDQVPGDFDVGKDYTVFRLTNTEVVVAPLICFEDTIGELNRRFVLPSNGNPGANLLVNVTNDGWFLRSAQSHQHLANAIFRCVETRRPMIRSANTGVTCFVNELGRVTQILQDDTGSTFTQGTLTGEVNVPVDRQLTFYVRHGELFAKVCAGLTTLVIVVRFLRRPKQATIRD
ncbi:MAG: apolipoprotein N-acyltransferase [Spartobacteria bacterium]